MPAVKKIKVSIIPYFEFEAAIATFFDENTYEIVPIDFNEKGLTEKFAQDLYGDWCCPLKTLIAAFEQVVTEKGVQKIISMNVNTCSYPMLMGNVEHWIKKEFEYYPIQMTGSILPVSVIRSAFDQLRKAIPEFNHLEAISKVPIAGQRFMLAAKLSEYYHQKIPLVKNARQYKKQFIEYKRAFINAKNLISSKQIIEDFKKITKKEIISEKSKYKFLVAGDIAVLIIDFPLVELDIFMAKHNAEILKSYTSYNFNYYTKYARKARNIISDVFSNIHNKTQVKDEHGLETAGLFQILKAKDEHKIDGIIYIKPNMCTPCCHLSYLLKRKNYFDIPTVEISYDEHSGANGVITRLEAFLNIVKENKREDTLRNFRF